jgi:hypothetical protein
MTSYQPRKSKYGLSEMEVGESRAFATPTPRDKKMLRRSAHNLNIRTDLYFMTRTTQPNIITVTRLK